MAMVTLNWSLSVGLTGVMTVDVTSPIIQVTLVALWLGLVALVAVVFGRRSHQGSSEIVRKIVHIGTGNVILLAWWFYLPAWIGINASVLFSGITLLSYWFPILPMIDGVGRHSWGTFFYSVSIGILIMLFWPWGLAQYAVIGILVMTWGDGMAALIGQRWGQHPFVIWGNTKSWEGSCAMAVFSFVVASAVLSACQGPIMATWGVALVIALVATTLELFSQYGIDNITVPLGSGAIAFGLNHLWLGL